MMDSETRIVLIFRVAVLINAALLGSLLLWDWLWISDLSLVRIAVNSQGEGSVWPPSAMWWAYVLYPWVSFFAYAGLLVFASFARDLFCAIIIFSLILAAGDGLSVAYGYEAFAETALGILDGVILTLAFLSPLRERFRKSRKHGVAH